jgi:hypothetical protein
VTQPIVDALRINVAGGPVKVKASFTTAESVRPLDVAAAILSRARRRIVDPGALADLKFGYAGAIAWLEFPSSRPNRRPSWRRTIIDRFLANTWRGLMVWPYPFAMTDVDTVLFALPSPDAHPKGLRVDDRLGSWKTKGRALRASEAHELMHTGGLRAVVEAMA